MKKDTYYFSHDANARNDIKILKIRRQIGAEAYAAYFMIIEVLREQVNFKLPMDSIPDLAYEFNISEEKVRAVIMNYGLFEIDDEIFFSSRLLRSMDEYNLIKTALSEAGKKGNLIRWRSGSDQVAIAPQSQLKEIKLNKSKVNKSIYIAPTPEEVKKYFIENGYSQKSSEKAYKYYNEANWFDGKGNKVKNWKQKMQGVWFKEENLENGEIKNQLSDRLPIHLKTLNPK